MAKVKLATILRAQAAGGPPMGSGSVTPPVTVNQDPVWLTTVPPLTIPLGGAQNLAIYNVDPEGDQRYHRRTGGTAPSGVTVATDGTISVAVGTALGTYTVDVEVDDAPFPAETGELAFGEIPDIQFVEGIAEVEQLGQFHLDGANLWTPGDFNRSSGWTMAKVASLKYASGAVLGTDSHLVYNTTTGALTYNGATLGPTEKYKVYNLKLTFGTSESMVFRVWIMRPTHVYGPTLAAAQAAVAAHPTWGAPATVGAASSQTSWTGLRSGTSGKAENDPRVIFIASGDYLVGGTGLTELSMKAADTAYPNTTSFCHILGDAAARPRFYRNTVGVGSLDMTYSCTTWSLRNLILEGVRIYEITLTSDMPANRYFSKIDQKDIIDRSADGLGSGADYKPSGHPHAARPNGIDGTVGTYFYTYFTSMKMVNTGDRGNQRHMCYIEGNGIAGSIWTNCILAGARACSSIKSIQGMLKTRNCLLSVAPDYDTFASESQTESAVPWAGELIDIKATALVVCFNTEFRLGVAANGKGKRRGIYIRNRLTALGSDVPPYPDANFSPPVGYDAGFGSGHTPIPGFAQDCSTYFNPAFWTAVNAVPLLDATNPYTFKKYFSYCTFRLMVGTPGDVYRDDGTSPGEPYVAATDGPAKFGLPTGWVERSIGFFRNSKFLGGYTHSVDKNTRYDLSNTLFVPGTGDGTGVEDGTGSHSEMYLVTWAGGAQGYARKGRGYVNGVLNEHCRSWSQSLNTFITNAGYTQLDPPRWSFIDANTTSQVRQPNQPPAKWPRTLAKEFPQVNEDELSNDYPNRPGVFAPLPAWFEV